MNKKILIVGGGLAAAYVLLKSRTAGAATNPLQRLANSLFPQSPTTAQLAALNRVTPQVPTTVAAPNLGGASTVGAGVGGLLAGLLSGLTGGKATQAPTQAKPTQPNNSPALPTGPVSQKVQQVTDGLATAWANFAPEWANIFTSRGIGNEAQAAIGASLGPAYQFPEAVWADNGIDSEPQPQPYVTTEETYDGYYTSDQGYVESQPDPESSPDDGGYQGGYDYSADYIPGSDGDPNLGAPVDDGGLLPSTDLDLGNFGFF